jgi:hypothetical protein
MKGRILLLVSMMLMSMAFLALVSNVGAQFDIEGKEPIWRRNIGSNVYSISISSDGSYIAATNNNGELLLLSNDDATLLWNFTSGTSSLFAKIAKSGDYIVAKSDTKLYYFSKSSGTPEWELDLDKTIESISICDDGRFVLATTEGNGTLISGPSGDIIRNYAVGDGWHPKGAISGDGNYIVVEDGKTMLMNSGVYFYSTSNSTLLWEDSIRHGYLDCFISYDAERILITQGFWTSGGAGGLSEGNHGSAHLYSKNGTKLWTKNIHGVYSEGMTSDGETIILGGSEPDNVYYLSSASDEPTWENSFVDPVPIVSISDTGEVVLVGSGLNIWIYDKDGTELWTRKVGKQKSGLSTNIIGMAEICDNGNYIVIGTTYGDVILFDPITPPLVNAGSDQSKLIGDIVSFSGSASDNQSDLVKYEWDFDGDGIYDYSSPETGNTEHTYTEAGSFIVRFRVTNEAGGSSIDTVTVGIFHKDDEVDEGSLLPIIVIVILIVTIGLVVYNTKRKKSK